MSTSGSASAAETGTGDVAGLARLDERDVRALTEPMDVYARDPATGGAHEVAVYHRGERRIVNTDLDFCTCPDHHYRGHRCKHIRRAAFALGETEVPGGIQWDALDAPLRNRLETPGELR